MNALDYQDQRDMARAIAVALEQDNARLIAVIADLVDPEPCAHFDHHGHCQTHGWMDDGVCPHARARALLDGAE